MNPEIIATRIRHFQAAKDLETMGEHSWQFACDLAETEPEELTEISQVSRTSWILPMLSFARRMLMQKSIIYTANVEQQMHLAGAFDEIDVFNGNLRCKCEMAVFDALLKLDEIALVYQYLCEFFAPKNLGFIKYRPELTTLTWLPAQYAQEHLKNSSPHVQLVLKTYCPWWELIASHGYPSKTE